MKFSQIVLILSSSFAIANGFTPSPSKASTTTTKTSLSAAPQRLFDNVDGPLYVNEKCINCAACAMFAPKVFSRRDGDGAHIVHHQPQSDEEIETARAALAACPVAAIRVETQAQRHHRKETPLSAKEETLTQQLAINPKFNGRSKPFPRLVAPESLPDNVYHVGHHNSASFGAAPYLVQRRRGSDAWVMVDTPKYSKSAVEAVESLTGPQGPEYLVLTHVDDTADHQKWKEHYPNLKRVFHAGDLGAHNWIGDKDLERVEVLLDNRSTPDKLQYFDLEGNPVSEPESEDLVIVHTPGHSPGSITLWKTPSTDSPGVLFTGDTYAYSTRDGGHMSGFPRYGNNRSRQAQILEQLYQELDWQVIVPGHGHVRDYASTRNDSEEDLRWKEMQVAIEELQRW